MINLTIFNKNLFEAGTEFFNQLGIQLNSNTAVSLVAKDILKDHHKAKGIFNAIDETYFLGLVDDSVFDRNSSLLDKEKISLNEAEEKIHPEYNGLMVFAVKLNDSYLPARGEIADLTRAFNRVSKSVPVVLLLKYGGLLSFASSERTKYKQAWREGEKIGKISLLKDININAPHTGHLKILEDLKVAPAVTDFNALYKQWQEVFNVQLLNKKFYQELFYWYLWAVKKVKFPQIRPKEDLIPDEAHQSESVIRLLTRLLFCWFMKEKQELIPELLFDKREVRKILNDFLPENKKSSVFYRAILQNLFFATLSVPIKNRKYIRESFQGKNRDYGNQYVYRYQNEFADTKENLKLFKDIPFLNGGLFECLDDVPENDDEKEIRLDGFSSKEKKQAFVPDYLFWGEYKGIDLSVELDKPQKKNETVHGIIDILNSYKFTIEENTPLEEEIALDPELLGKVFESLLAYYNPETKANARKQTGSFYTPREIVNYMVDESLIAAFQQKLGDAGITENVEPRLRDLISYHETENPFSEKETNVLIQALENLKVLDPACGSGAFPMGILHKLVWVLQKVDPENKKWFESIIKRLPEYAQSEMRKKLEGENWDYLRKLGIIQQSVYGVDIQPIAIQIAKLRFFISLLVDQDIKGNGENNFGLQPLPNLDFKLVSANTLIGAPEQGQQDDGKLFFAQDVFFDKFNALTGQYFGTYEPAEKKKLTKKIEKLVSDKVQEKVDEIQRLGTHTDERFSKHIAEKNKAIIEQKKNDAKLWESYNNLFKHESVGFFEPKYFFPEVKDGFDIVIANPPYINISKIDKSLVELYKTKYKSAQYGRFDLYVVFIEFALNLLKNNGVQSFIVPDKVCYQKYAINIRKIILDTCKIKQIINLKGIKVFESAVVDNIVYIFQKGNSQDNVVNVVDVQQGQRLEDSLLNAPHSIKQDLFKIFNECMFRLALDEKDLIILQKVREKALLLRDICYISFGLQPGNLDKFVFNLIDNPERANVNNNHQRKFIRGRNVNRYYITYSNDVVFYLPMELHRPAFSELFENDKIIISEISKDIKCAFDGEHYYSNEKTVIVVPWEIFETVSKDVLNGRGIHLSKDVIINSKRFALFFILAVLNSKITNYFFQKLISDGLNVYPDNVRELPIPNVSSKQQKPFIEIVDIILAITKSSDYLENSAKQTKVKEYEEQIDEMVYALYDLTPEEIAIVEGKG